MVDFKFFTIVLSVVSTIESYQVRPFYAANTTATVDRCDHHQVGEITEHYKLHTARKDQRTRWPYGYIPFKISPDLDVARSNILEATKIWNEATCLYFYEANSISPNVPHLFLMQTGTGCNAGVGKYTTKHTKQVVSLDGGGCFESVPVIIHELGHALGLWHEQDRPYRENYVTIHLDNLSTKSKNYFKNPVWDVETYGLYYDYSSIMQYSAYAFSINGRMTLVPKDPLAEAVMGYARKPSFRDFHLVNKMYKCTDRCIHISCSNGGYAAWNYQKDCRCMCPPGYEGSSCQNSVSTGPNCVYSITSPGTFSTPHFPHKMIEDTRCAWLIKAPHNKQIRLKFNVFDMLGRYQHDCLWDYLRIRKIDLQSDDPGVVYCGQELKQQTLYAYKEMLLLLSTYKYGSSSKGFEASVSFV